MACPECGNENLQVEFNGNKHVLVCYECDTVVDGDAREPSLEEIEDDHSDDGDYFEDTKSSENVKHSVEDLEDSTSVLSDRVNTEEASGLSETAEFRVHKASQPSESEGQRTGEAGRETSVPTCRSCGGTSFTEDAINETEQLICRDCGFFEEKQTLVSIQEYTAISGSSDSYQWSRAPRPRFMNNESQINKNKAYGVRIIQDMATQLNWQTFLTDQSVALYEQLYPHQQVKYTTNNFKEGLCVACMYSIARENNVKITLKTLTGLKKVQTKWVTKALKVLKSISKKPLAPQTVSSLPEHILATGKFSTQFVEKVSKLVQVCEKGFVTQGRDHTNVVIAVAHLAWISEDYTKYNQRRSVSLSKFCSQYNLCFGKYYVRIQKHIKELFKTLVRKLPWLCTPIGGKDYLRYLDGIASYGLSMISKASKEESVTGSESSDSLKCTSADLEVPVTPSLSPPLAPPSMKSVKRQRPGQSPTRLPAHLSAADLDKEDLSETEFSDQEIASYILSPKETQLKQTLTGNDMESQSLKK